MESPSPSLRRQAWVQTSRQWQTLENDPQAPSQPPPPPPPPFFSTEQQHFTDECCSIESWLLRCGQQLGPDGSGQLPGESGLRSCSFEDDLSLGAEAPVFSVEDEGLGVGSCPLLLPPPKSRQKGPSTSTPGEKLRLPQLTLGHSMASSGFSSSTSRTAFSVSEVLQLCSEDAEDTLYQLGFGSEVAQPSARIPPRFLRFPSRLGGISFRLFLQAQLLRLRQEDPDLSLASRFRQVEVLTAMANAFSSLYSHVSRTPVQKLAPPDLSLSSPSADRTTARFLSSVRSEPRSPVDRLKDTVSRMCLYTGSSRGSENGTPQPSPRKRASLPDLVDLLMENTSERARVEDQGSGVEDLGSGVEDLGSGVEDQGSGGRVEDQGSGGRVEDLGSGVEDLGSGVEDLGSGVEDLGSGVEDQGSGERVEDQGSGGRVKDQGSWVEDQGSGVEDQGSGVEDQGSGVEDLGSGVEDQGSGRRVEDQGSGVEDQGSGRRVEAQGSGGREEDQGSGVEDQGSGGRVEDQGSEGRVEDQGSGVEDLGSGGRVEDQGSGVEDLASGGRVEDQGSERRVEDQGSGGRVEDHTLQQTNSFELEEVVIAGEDEPEQDSPGMMGLLGSSGLQLKGLVGRGDSLQSDSSGYAEEDISLPDS
ncbi:protein TESPA1 [Hypomesus transpacificus]|uniref:protein TESPA1 n=1 Tax=Hypomesus transpacificus TaxID=137520 RepID=UPI001F08167F|nr:protein TESPA1 [Hypomesus transpacificus]